MNYIPSNWTQVDVEPQTPGTQINARITDREAVFRAALDEYLADHQAHWAKVNANRHRKTTVHCLRLFPRLVSWLLTLAPARRNQELSESRN